MIFGENSCKEAYKSQDKERILADFLCGEKKRSHFFSCFLSPNCFGVTLSRLLEIIILLLLLCALLNALKRAHWHIFRRFSRFLLPTTGLLSSSPTNMCTQNRSTVRTNAKTQIACHFPALYGSSAPRVWVQFTDHNPKQLGMMQTTHRQGGYAFLLSLMMKKTGLHKCVAASSTQVCCANSLAQAQQLSLRILRELRWGHRLQRMGRYFQIRTCNWVTLFIKQQ